MLEDKTDREIDTVFVSGAIPQELTKQLSAELGVPVRSALGTDSGLDLLPTETLAYALGQKCCGLTDNRELIFALVNLSTKGQWSEPFGWPKHCLCRSGCRCAVLWWLRLPVFHLEQTIHRAQ